MVRILVVDDSQTARTLIRSALLSIGYNEISEAEDGVKALEILRTKEFDLMITDWNMPNMNGLDLTTTVRNDPVLNHLPIIFITTRNEREDFKKALKIQINGYLIKPFNAESLKRSIAPIAQKILYNKSVNQPKN